MSAKAAPHDKMLKLYNTLTRKKEEFKPVKPSEVGLYACGPTVYDYAHLGHFRAYVFVDILRRSLEYSGFQVKHVMNITDVGHLMSDQDIGEDKMEVGAKREKKTVREIAKFYTDDYFSAMEKLNVLRPQVVCQATEHIEEMIDLVKKIEKNGFAYKISDGIYFDTSKLADYGKLAGLDIEGLREGARVEANPEKKNPTDFALWRFSPKGEKRTMEWDSPWGRGFPGWHIECTAMGVKYLGEEFDIHTGGVDHIPIHHTNEIAQAQGAFGHDVVRFWMHNEFLLVEGKKMSKSLRNIFNIHDVEKRGFDPLALRYLFLTTHYRKRMNFTWKSLEGAQQALRNLHRSSSGVEGSRPARSAARGDTPEVKSWQRRFLGAINDDLNTPQALAIVWDLLKAKIADKDKRKLLLDFDRVLGLKLGERRTVEKIPDEVQELIEEREKLRKQKKWGDADKVRQKIEKTGWGIEDTAEGPKIKKIL